jgi:hypothetical protein
MQILSRPVGVHGKSAVVVAQNATELEHGHRWRDVSSSSENQNLWLALLAMQKGEDRGRKFLPSLEEVELQDKHEAEQRGAQFLHQRSGGAGRPS